MAASSKCGETTTMREKTSGSTSPQVGSAKAALMPGSYGHVVDLTGDVVSEHGQERADDGGAGDAGQATRDDGELDAGQRRPRCPTPCRRGAGRPGRRPSEWRTSGCGSARGWSSAGWCCAARRRSRRPSPPTASRTRATQSVSVNPNSAMASAPDGDRHDHRPALPAQVGDPAGGDGADERARRRARRRGSRA